MDLWFHTLLDMLLLIHAGIKTKLVKGVKDRLAVTPNSNGTETH